MITEIATQRQFVHWLQLELLTKLWCQSYQWPNYQLLHRAPNVNGLQWTGSCKECQLLHALKRSQNFVSSIYYSRLNVLEWNCQKDPHCRKHARPEKMHNKSIEVWKSLLLLQPIAWSESASLHRNKRKTGERSQKRAGAQRVWQGVDFSGGSIDANLYWFIGRLHNFSLSSPLIKFTKLHFTLSLEPHRGTEFDPIWYRWLLVRNIFSRLDSPKMSFTTNMVKTFTGWRAKAAVRCESPALSYQMLHWSPTFAGPNGFWQTNFFSNWNLKKKPDQWLSKRVKESNLASKFTVYFNREESRLFSRSRTSLSIRHSTSLNYLFMFSITHS